MNEKFKVVQITDGNDSSLDIMSRWIYDWWGKDQGRTQPQIRDYYGRAVFKDRLPQTFAAFDGDTLVGGFQFAMEDCYVRPDIYPWIKNVYVDESMRGRGYSGLMLEAAVKYAGEAGIRELSLFTHMEGFYEKYGWEFVETFDTHVAGIGVQRLYVRKF